MLEERNHAKGRAGNSLIEFAFAVPFCVFLFIGAFDMGIYCYALISLQSAVRTAAVYTSTSSTTATDSTTACRYVLAQLRDLPNVPSTVTTCAASPVTVTATQVTGPDSASAARVTATYNFPALPGIPFLPSRVSVTRNATMRLQN